MSQRSNNAITEMCEAAEGIAKRVETIFDPTMQNNFRLLADKLCGTIVRFIVMMEHNIALTHAYRQNAIKLQDVFDNRDKCDSCETSFDARKFFNAIDDIETCLDEIQSAADKPSCTDVTRALLHGVTGQVNAIKTHLGVCAAANLGLVEATEVDDLKKRKTQILLLAARDQYVVGTTPLKLYGYCEELIAATMTMFMYMNH